MSNRVENQGMRLFGSIDKKTGWVIMEIPILLVVCYFFFQGQHALNVSAIMVGVFVMHYFNRAIIFPQRIKVKGKTMPIMSMVSSMIFYIINGYLIGHYFGHLREYSIEWLVDPRFIIGLGLFIAGFIINIQSDNILINLRKPGETGYKIPQGGFFNYVSCPNYMGECIEWIGFAIMTWSLPGVAYALWVVLPLYAQALGSHQWYQETFKDDYPASRKAIIPFIR
jgi:protein-S-isoprenylcysteine O-methyltransferase Ste14